MTHYFVKWEIDIEASCPELAAQTARDIQLNPESIATVLDVETRSEIDIDLRKEV